MSGSQDPNQQQFASDNGGHLVPTMDEVDLAPDCRSRLGQRAAKLGLLDPFGRPHLGLLTSHHFERFRAQGMTDAQAFGMLGDPADADLQQLHEAIKRGAARRLEKWQGPPVDFYPPPPDVMQRLWDRAKAEGCADPFRLVDRQLLARTMWKKPTPDQVREFVDDASDPDIQALARALFHGKPATVPLGAVRH